MIKWGFNTQMRRLRFFCTYKGTSEVSKNVQSADFLLNNLKTAHSTKYVLDMVGQHGAIMNNKHIMQSLRSLFTLQKNGNSDLSTNQILAHKDFNRLCRKLRSQAGVIELGETIEALKVVSFVGVPSDSTIFQVLLQLIRHNVNSLRLHQIIFLDFLLSQTKENPLVSAIKIALPIVFDVNLSVKIDTENASHLADYLFYASHNSLSQETIDIIVNSLMRHKHFDTKTCRSIIWSLCDLKTDEVYQPLMRKAINSLNLHAEEIPFGELESTLTKLVSRYSKKNSYFYDETFFDACANCVIDRDLGYKQSVYVLKKFARVNFFHKFLLDYMSRKVIEDPGVLAQADAPEMYSIAMATAMTDYRPTHWEELKRLIMAMDKVFVGKKEIIWLKFGAALCLLDVYRLDVLSKCLEEQFLKEFFKGAKFQSDFENYATIWQCIKLFKPELNCLLSKAYHPEVLCKWFKPNVEFVLEPALHKALGGENYVKTNLYSKHGIFIDHAILFRKGGYPVALNSSQEVEFLEDIEVAPEHYLVAILGLRHYNYTLNAKRMKGNVSLNIKVLESQGIHVVPVDLEGWEALLDFERIPYLMRTIKERTLSDLSVSEGVI